MLIRDDDREVIPRWRSFRATLESGELDPLAARVPMRRPTRTDVDIDLRLSEWRDHQTSSYAADLLAAAFVLGDEMLIREAAKAIQTSRPRVPPLGASVAQFIVNELDLSRTPIVEEPPVAGELDGALLAPSRISHLRQSLRREQRNAIGWAELARFHAIVGNRRRSRRAMLVALDLAPDSRFILRSASRLAVHLDDPEWGYSVLRKSARTGRDPWLTSAEISLAALIERPSKLIKVARQMMDSSSFTDRDTAEVAAALGTREMEISTRRAKRLFVQALRDPTENAVAQAVWAADEMNWTFTETERLDLPISFEARARAFARAGDRPAALVASWRWFSDEPFAAEPPIFASYHASTDEDYDTGLAFATEGLKANPDDITLLNNAAFCLACSGRPDEARRVLSRTKFGPMHTDEDRAAFLATRGLIDYRSGLVEDGRRNYAAALTTTRDVSIRALAAIMFAREEIHAQTPFGEEAAQRAFRLEEEARRAGGVVAAGELRAWLRQLQAAMAESAVK